MSQQDWIDFRCNKEFIGNNKVRLSFKSLSEKIEKGRAVRLSRDGSRWKYGNIVSMEKKEGSAIIEIKFQSKNPSNKQFSEDEINFLQFSEQDVPGYIYLDKGFIDTVVTNCNDLPQESKDRYANAKIDPKFIGKGIIVEGKEEEYHFGGEDLPKLDLEMKTVKVEAKQRKLKAKWTISGEESKAMIFYANVKAPFYKRIWNYIVSFFEYILGIEHKEEKTLIEKPKEEWEDFGCEVRYSSPNKVHLVGFEPKTLRLYHNSRIRYSSDGKNWKEGIIFNFTKFKEESNIDEICIAGPLLEEDDVKFFQVEKPQPANFMMKPGDVLFSKKDNMNLAEAMKSGQVKAEMVPHQSGMVVSMVPNKENVFPCDTEDPDTREVNSGENRAILEGEYAQENNVSVEKAKEEIEEKLNRGKMVMTENMGVLRLPNVKAKVTVPKYMQEEIDREKEKKKKSIEYAIVLVPISWGVPGQENSYSRKINDFFVDKQNLIPGVDFDLVPTEFHVDEEIWPALEENHPGIKYEVLNKKAYLIQVEGQDEKQFVRVVKFKDDKYDKSEKKA